MFSLSVVFFCWCITSCVLCCCTEMKYLHLKGKSWIWCCSVASPSLVVVQFKGLISLSPKALSAFCHRSFKAEQRAQFWIKHVIRRLCCCDADYRKENIEQIILDSEEIHLQAECQREKHWLEREQFWKVINPWK